MRVVIWWFYVSFVVISFCLLYEMSYAGNERVDDFVEAKRLMRVVYDDVRRTFYCGAEYDGDGIIVDYNGYESYRYEKRSRRIEWEHVVPAENFGRNFVEWREGSFACVSRSGERYRGRKCAERVSYEYRLMQADMHNLVPAIGSVNAMRSNYNFQMLGEYGEKLGLCDFRVVGGKVQPPEGVRGFIARVYKYMDYEYDKYEMSDQQRQLMNAWDEMYPVSSWECLRNERIAKIQGNYNKFVSRKCK